MLTFFLSPVQAAGIPRHYAPTVGIAVDHRRQNLSEESLVRNVERLKSYLSRLIVFPRKSNNPKKGDTPKAAQQAADSATLARLADSVPAVPGFSEIRKGDAPAPVEGGAYVALRQARANARYAGAREKRAKEKAEAEANKK